MRLVPREVPLMTPYLHGYTPERNAARASTVYATCPPLLDTYVNSIFALAPAPCRGCGVF